MLEPHAPGFHVPAVSAAGKQKGTTTPVLVLPPAAPDATPSVVDDSAAILRWVDGRAPPAAPRLFPPAHAEEVASLCARFDEHVGPAARLWVYSHALETADVNAALTADPVPSHERFLWHYAGVGYLVRRLMCSGLGVDRAAGDAALDVLRREFAHVSERLSDGRSFLCGDAFSAADLTFAALAAPALGVAYGDAPPWQTEASAAAKPPALRAAEDELRATPAGAFALRMFERERRRVVVETPPSQS